MATVVIVPGSFAPPRSYDIFTSTLNQHGIQWVVVDLPSVGRREGKPPQTMTDDVNEITRVVSALLDEGKETILMTHSYGGVPGSQSLEKLSPKARGSVGKSGGVKKIVYLTSVVIPVGVSNFDLSSAGFPDFLTVEDDYMTVDPAGNTPFTFSDIPFEEGFKHAKEMTTHSTASFKEKVSYVGYDDVEVHYIVCEEDKVVLPEHQYGMIEMIKATSGREVGVHKLKSGHAPTVSQPDNLAKILKGIMDSS